MRSKTPTCPTAIVVAVLCALLATGCSLKQLATHGPEEDWSRLDRDLDVLPPFPQPAAASGSLWTDAGPGAALVRDTRAFRVNDLVRIRVAEASLGTQESSTGLTRSSSHKFGADVLLGFEPETPPSPGHFNWANALDTSTESSHQGDGKTTRSTQLSGYITARVLRVLPNGDLAVAGQKTVVVNRERQVLTLVGSVRPVDVGPTNEVSSSAVGDLTVRLWGRGEIDSTIREGWFMRIMKNLWPF